MKEKKQHSNWYTALIHFSIAGFAAPILALIIVTFLSGFITSIIIVAKNTSFLASFTTVLESSLSSIIIFIIGILAIWLGVKYSANHLKKNYIIKDINSVIKISTIYMLLWGVGNNLFSSLSALVHNQLVTKNLISFVIACINVVLFYIFSKKYIRDTENTITQ